MNIFEITEKEHHKLCKICKGSKTTSQMIKCSKLPCPGNYQCHLLCLDEEIRKGISDGRMFFCETCRPQGVTAEVVTAGEFSTFKSEMDQKLSEIMKALGSLSAIKSKLDLMNSTALNQTGLFDETLRHEDGGKSTIQPNTSHEDLNASSMIATVEHTKLMSLRERRKNLGDLPEYDGDCTAWLKFKLKYQRIKKEGEYTNDELVVKLDKALKGKAKAQVQMSLNSSIAKPDEIVKDLEQSFFDPDIIIQEAFTKILSLPTIAENNRLQLQTLYQHVNAYIDINTQLDAKEKLSDRLPYSVEVKLPTLLHKDWMVVKHSDRKPSWLEFSEFLSKEVMKARADFGAMTSKVKTHGKINAVNSMGSSSSSKKSTHKKPRSQLRCSVCKSDHALHNCEEFKKFSYDKRVKHCIDNDRCDKCLRRGHARINCPLPFTLKCRIEGCKNSTEHCSAMHPDTKQNVCTFNNDDTEELKLMQILPVEILDADGVKHQVNAFVDNGSNVTIISLDLFQKLRLVGTPHELKVGWITRGKATFINTFKTEVKLYAVNGHHQYTLENVIAFPDLCLPSQSQDAKFIKKKFPHLARIPIPTYKYQMPQILIGTRHRSVTATIETIFSPNPKQSIVAERTPLGWTLSANYSNDSVNVIMENVMAKHLSEPTGISNEELHELMKKFMNSDVSHPHYDNAQLITPDEQRAMEVKQQTMKLVDNRYEIGLYWKSEDVKLPNNYASALKRLSSTEHTLKKKNLVEWANQHHETLLKLNFAREATEEDLNPPIPHPRVNYVIGFVVINPNKHPPKPRWVVDTASKHEGVSLNSALVKGEDNLIPLTQALFHFRERKFAIAADVEKQFHQVKIIKADQQCQRYLWRNCNVNESPKTYIFTSMLFGPTDSPSKANSVRMTHAENCRERHPRAAEAALNSMYMDDFFHSENNCQEAINTAKEAISMFSEISWNLTDFRSNTAAILEQIPESQVNQKAKLELQRDDHNAAYCKVLGIYWDPVDDCFTFELIAEAELVKKSMLENYHPTKREILGFIMRIFDCLGLISHFTIRGKLIMQDIWQENIDWDDHISEGIFQSWKCWLTALRELSELKIPRHYGFSQEVKATQLHVFTDASMKAYCAVCYLRFEMYDGKIITSMVLSKARVAPLKYASMPNLELRGAVLGVQLAKVVQDQHKRLSLESRTFWTDSTTNLKRIKGVHLKMKAVLAPKICEIRENSDILTWRYVKSEENSADDGTKCNEINFSDANHRWYTAPPFLAQNPQQWPKDITAKFNELTQDDDSVETLPTNTIAVVKSRKEVEKEKYLCGNFQIAAKIRADWKTYRRVIAVALRYLENLKLSAQEKARNTSHSFNVKELEKAEYLIIRTMQSAYWPGAATILTRGGSLKMLSQQLAALNAFICPHGLMRCSTRLSHANVNYDVKFPIILPNKHEVTTAIVTYYHHRHNHVGHEAINASIREKYWIIHSRSAVRRVAANCTFCKHLRATPYKTPVAPIPDIRVNTTCKAFEITGADCFGPFEVFAGKSRRTKKIYVVIFTCLTSRAVYLRMLSSMNTDEMLLAIQDLWTRRGPIRVIVSDNGKNFVGAANFFNKEFKDKLAENFSLTWQFNPPYTPQWGGAWERLIKDIKRSLKNATNSKKIPEKEFEAALLQIEDQMNGRPLTNVPVTCEDEPPLTPNELIKFHHGSTLLPAEAEKLPVENQEKKLIKRARGFVKRFMSKFTKEHLPIITRMAPNQRKNSIAKGDYVIYIDPTIPPNAWKKGVVVETYAGRDGVCRVADVKLAGGELVTKRSAIRLAKIDIVKDIEMSNEGQKSADRVKNLTLTVEENLNRPTTFINSYKNLHEFPNFLEREKIIKNSRNPNTNQLKLKMDFRANRLAVRNLLEELKSTRFIAQSDLVNLQYHDSEAQYIARLRWQEEFRDKTGKKTVKVVCADNLTSIYDVLLGIVAKGVMPARLFFNDRTRGSKNNLYFFIILEEEEQCEKLLEAGSFPLGDGKTAAVSRPATHRVFFDQRYGYEHAILRWEPYKDVHCTILITRKADSKTKARAVPIIGTLGVTHSHLLRKGDLLKDPRIREKDDESLELRRLYSTNPPSAQQASIAAPTPNELPTHIGSSQPPQSMEDELEINFTEMEMDIIEAIEEAE